MCSTGASPLVPHLVKQAKRVKQGQVEIDQVSDLQLAVGFISSNAIIRFRNP